MLYLTVIGLTRTVEGIRTVDVPELIRMRLEQLDYEQSDLAAAVQVTQSFISQLLNRKKRPPSPHRTDIYRKMEDFLKLPPGDLGRLADLQLKQELKTKIEPQPSPLFEEVREVILRKCLPGKEKQIRQIFAKEPFGDIERIVTQKLVDVAKGIAREEWKNENWLRVIARLNNKSYEEMRVIVLEFLDTDVFGLSMQNCTCFLEPLIASWDIDLITFRMSVTLNPQLGKEQLKRFAFVELEPDESADDRAGLREFLSEYQLSLDIAPEEVVFLKALRIKGRRPNTLYYYRELQNLRDPLHFLEVRITNRKDAS
jgi:transcriptional regulator with XRE-family HTH domain